MNEIWCNIWKPTRESKMSFLFTSTQFNNSTRDELLKLKCDYCSNPYQLNKHRIQGIKKRGSEKTYCCARCQHDAKIKTINIPCFHCQSVFKIQKHRITKRNFCSHKCHATYMNKHKIHGTRRSKLEIWIEQILKELYPTIDIHFNRKDTINSELDIYIPSLKIAFELNGIFHYEPIYGPEKLAKIQNNDCRKFQACLEKHIELCIIDTSKISYFKIDKVQHIFEIIKSIIDKKIGSLDRNQTGIVLI